MVLVIDRPLAAGEPVVAYDAQSRPSAEHLLACGSLPQGSGPGSYYGADVDFPGDFVPWEARSRRGDPPRRGGCPRLRGQG